MKGTAEVGIKVKVICSRCGRDVRVDVRDGVGNVPPEIEVDPCEWCEEDARSEAVAEALKEEL
jgi:hypothetical protein